MSRYTPVLIGWSTMVLLALSGCGSPVLQSLATSVAAASLTERQQDRVELQVQAKEKAVAEQFPAAETASSYLQLIVQMQQKSLWFASLAHLDALEMRWGPAEESSRLRADALRHVGALKESEAIYLQMLQGAQAGAALHGLGLLAAAQNDYVVAAKHLEQARRLQPTDAMLLNDYALVLMHTATPLQARLPLMQAAQLQPNHRRIQSNVALFLLLHGKEGEAQDWMQRHLITPEVREQIMQAAARVTQSHAKAPALLPTTEWAQETASVAPAQSVAAAEKMLPENESAATAQVADVGYAPAAAPRVPSAISGKAAPTDGSMPVGFWVMHTTPNNEWVMSQSALLQWLPAMQTAAVPHTEASANLESPESEPLQDAVDVSETAPMPQVAHVCSDNVCYIPRDEFLPRDTALVPEHAGGATTEPANAVSAVHHAAFPMGSGAATRSLLQMQARGDKSVQRRYPVTGAEGQKIYERYVNSFGHPIAEKSMTTLGSGVK